MWVLDNRELALLIWMVALVILLAVYSRTRASLGSLARQVFASKLTFVFAAMLLYVMLLCLLAGRTNLWTAEQVPESVIWFFAGGLVVLMNADKAEKGEPFIRRAVLEAVGLGAAIEFVASTEPFPLVVEVLLVPFLVVLGGLIAVADYQGQESRQVKRLLEGILAVLGLAMLANSVRHAVIAPGDFFSVATLRDFLVPILLTVGFVPFVYLVALFMMYESLFVRINFLVGEQDVARYAKGRIIRKAKLRVRNLRPIAVGAGGPFYRNMSRQDVDQAIEQLTLTMTE